MEGYRTKMTIRDEPSSLVGRQVQFDVHPMIVQRHDKTVVRVKGARGSTTLTQGGVVVKETTSRVWVKCDGLDKLIKRHKVKHNVREVVDHHILDNDQPATCPKCLWRTEFTEHTDDKGTPFQKHQCPNCSYRFIGTFEEKI